MNKQIVQGILAFIAVCGMGFFTSMAGGVVWGTGDAGAASFLTLFIASVVLVFVGFMPRDV